MYRLSLTRSAESGNIEWYLESVDVNTPTPVVCVRAGRSTLPLRKSGSLNKRAQEALAGNTRFACWVGSLLHGWS